MSLSKEQPSQMDGIALEALRYAASRGDADAAEKVKAVDEAIEKKHPRKAGTLPPPTCVKEGFAERGKAASSVESPEESAEDTLALMWKRVNTDPGYFDGYTQIINILKKQAGREPELRRAYEMILKEFPLCYGYWARLADLEEESWAKKETIYKEGLQFLPTNPHLWLAYLEQIMVEKYKVPLETIRAVVDKALDSCGLHWNSYPVWKLCLEFEEQYLKFLCGSELSHVEKQKLEQRTTLRIRTMYFRALRTPISKLSGIWEKFKVLIGQGKTETQTITLDVTDLLVEQEFEEFQTFVVQNYVKEEDVQMIKLERELMGISKDTLHTWRRTSDGAIDLTGDRDTAPEVAAPSAIPIEVRFPDKSTLRFQIEASTSIKDLREACCSNSALSSLLSSQNRKAVDLLFNGRVLKACKTAEQEGITPNALLTVFDGSTLAKALELSSGRAVEKWFLRKREQLFLDCCTKRERAASFESKLKRNYFHPLPLSPDQLTLWRDYLDSESTHGNEKSIQTLYHRAIENCSNYPEFWQKYAAMYGQAGQVDAALKIYEYASKHFLRWRPDIRFLHAEFLERHGKWQDAVNILQSVISPGGIAPGMIEGYVRLISVHRRHDQLADCDRLFDEAFEILKGRPMDRSRIVMERGYFTLSHKKDLSAAIEILREESQLNRKNLALLKYYLSLLKMHPDTTARQVIQVYENALAESQLSLVSKWMVWKDFLFYLEREAPSFAVVAETKDRFDVFLRKHVTELENCRRKRRGMSGEESHEKRKKQKADSQTWTQAEWEKYMAAYGVQAGSCYPMNYNQYYMAYYNQCERSQGTSAQHTVAQSENDNVASVQNRTTAQRK